MSDPNFDPYYKWLGISADDQPANHYRLLGVDQFESDADVIESAAQRQIAHVRTFALGNYAEASQALLNELSTARVTLLNPDRKKEYDKRLKAELQSNVPSIGQGSGESRQQRALVEVAIEPVPGRNRVSSRRASAAPRRKKLPLGVIGLVVLVLGIVIAFSLYVSFSGGDNRVAVTNEKVSSEATAKQGIAAEKESPPDRKELPANKNTLGNAIASGASTQSSTQEKSAGLAPVASVDPEPSESAPIASTGTPEPSGSDAAAVMSGVVGDPPPPAIAPFDATTAKKHQEAWAEHLGVTVETENSIGMKLRVIPAGTFTMGEGGRGQEVTLTKPFMLGTHEVTQEQYEKIMDINPSLSKGGIKPVTHVSWEDAVKFCLKLSELPAEKAAGRIYRLPTEAQWEHACRSGTQTTYSFGDDESKLGDYGWFRDNSNGRNHPCGVKQPNAWGLSDMHGNVWEWCNDWFGSSLSGSATDPKGPQSGSSHVLRGASFGDYAVDCRSASRARDRSNPHVYGFRVSCVPSIAANTKIATSPPMNSGEDVEPAAATSPPVPEPANNGPAPAVAPFAAEQAKAYQEAWANYLGVPVEFTNSIGMKLRVMPPGVFLMGSQENDREKPVHQVTLTRPFMMGVYEVTQAEYERIMNVNASRFKGPRNPVETMTWVDAKEFCRRLSLRPEEKAAGREYRLPTEAEWEYACRAGTISRFSFGDNDSALDEYGWHSGNGGRATHAVGSKLANPFGLYDMHGNVWEWCQDYFSKYRSIAVTDPVGTSDGSVPVRRGGSWVTLAGGCRSAGRALDPVGFRYDTVGGFRVACVSSSTARTQVATSPPMNSGEDVEPAATTSPPVPEPANNGPAPAVAPFAAEQAKAYQEAWANYLGVPVEFTNSIGMKFSLIPPGEFLMGDPRGTTVAEAGRNNGVTVPVRKVTISEPFFLGVHEVSRSQYTSVIDVSPVAPNDGQLPINGMSWEDAVAFCKRLSQRSQGVGREEQYSLPSEAQWEYACRAGSQSRYFFGEDAAQLKDYAVSKASGARGPSRIGTKKPNAWGLYDMHGNLWEWCNDWYGVYQTDSQNGPATGNSRIQRGGCWNDAGVTTGYRNMNPPQLKHNLHGFRVALAIPAKKEIKEVETATNPKKDKYTLRIMQSKFGNRVGASKVAALAEFGGTQASEAAVAEALKWFARHQMPNGGWTFQHDLVCRGQCTDSCDSSYNKSYNAATAMALLPFLGAGQTQYTGEFKQNVKLGLLFLRKNGKQGKKNGLPVLDLRDETGNMYSHGLAAIALCEAYGMTKDRALLPYAQASLNFIFTAQCSDGGWRYSPDGTGGGDTSVLGWQVTALKSGLMAKLAVPPQTIQGSTLFLDKVQSNGGAVYGYTGSVPRFRPATSSIGLLGRMYTGWDKTHPGIVGGLKELREQGFSKNDFYYNYYASQVLIQSGGDAWDEFNVEMRDYLVETQSQEGGAKGSWYVKGGHTSNAGRLCITSFATMMLEVYYRNLPLQ